MKKTDMTGLEIAVIGYAGKFNNCSNVHEYWTKLRGGEETFAIFKEEELQAIGIPEEIYRKENYIPVRGSLGAKDCFDARFFGYTPDEAYIMDPQIRIFHEIVWQGLEMAGYAPGKTNQRIGLYASASDNAVWQAMMSIKGLTNAGGFETAYLSSKDYLCSLISYKLNLKGPAVFIQTSCSSSLVAVHQAARAVLTGDCDIAIAGGVSVSLFDKGGYLYQENLIYSSDGHCRAFDAGASGTLKGEGGGVVVLKKYKDAIRDRDTIYGVIKGSAINNDGNEKMGFTAPGVNGQKKVIRHALQIANIDPDTVSYVETHGTGTRLGDPVEFKALCEAYGPAKKIRAAIGSVKTNIGHLDASAGIAALIKVLLMIYHRQIPASLHFNDPNPEIDFDRSPFYVNNRLKEWVPGDGILRAGISSFGIGGTNCHMIVEEPPVQLFQQGSANGGYVFNLSAKTAHKLNETGLNLAEYLSANRHIRLSDLSYTLNVGRQDFNHRRSVIANTMDELIDKLKEQDGGREVRIKDKEAINRSVVFVFSGQGAQYRCMGRELYNRSVFFKARMQEVFSLITKYNNIVLEDVLFSTDETDKRINETLYAQLALFAISYSTAALLRRMGIEPAALIGHSIGEYAAAVIADILTLEDAVRIIGKRALLMQGVESGKMYTVFAGEHQVKELLSNEVSIAAINSPGAVVVSGNDKAIDKLVIELAESNILFKKLHTSHAFHSPMMENIMQEYTSFLKSFTFRKGIIPLVSNISGQFFETIPGVDYWGEHIRETVRFSDGINTLREAGYTTFIEVGPGNQLIKMIEGTIGSERFLLENTIRPAVEKADDHVYFMQKISRLWQHGWPVDYSVLSEGDAVKKISLPTYPFDSIPFPLQTNLTDIISAINGSGRSVPGTGEWLYQPVWNKQKIELPVGIHRKENGCMLVFCDDTGYADQIAGRLNTGGNLLIRVRRGDEYNKLNEHNYTINLFDAGGYSTLLEDLKRHGYTISTIIHCLNLDDAHSSFEEALDAGYLGLCYIAQALSKCRFEDNIRFRILARGSVKFNEADDIDPVRAMAIGAAKIISVEYDNLSVRFIDIIPSDIAHQGFATMFNDELHDSSDNVLVAYRGGDRYIPLVTPLKQMPAAGKKLRKDGCYVITGGLGGMGLAIAEDMAAKEHVRIALISRRRFVPKENWENWLKIHGEQDATSRIIGRLKNIESKGARVLVICADVADFMQMRGAITKIERDFGKINGVIWSAGVIDYDGIIQRRNREQLVRNISSKVNGILIAEQLINWKELDWLVLFSSIGNIYYREKFGQVAYNVANEFLDAYAQSRTDVFVSAISWCDWKEVGMSVNGLNNIAGLTTDQKNEILKDGLAEKEGVQAFWQCLESGCKKVVVSKKDLSQEAGTAIPGSNETGTANQPASIRSFERPELSTPFEAPSAPLEHYLASLCCDLFGIRQVGVNDNFLELGGDSLKAVHYINRIKKEKKVKLTLEDFFSHPTVAGLAAIVASRLPAEMVPLLPSQNRIFIFCRLEPEQTSYNQVFIFRTKPVPYEKLCQVAQQLLQIHQVLRACFTMVDGNPVQKFIPDVRPCIDVYNIENDNGFPEVARKFERPFDLSLAPLFRIGYANNTTGSDYLMIDLHHIISDGLSSQLFLNDLARLLADQALEAAPADFKSYIEWFNTPEVQEEIRQEENYWLERFRDFVPAKGLPTDYPRKPADSREGDRFSFTLPALLTQQVIELEKREKITPFVFNLAVLYILLYKLSGDEDPVIGATHFGRDYPGFEKVMGMFIETMALRNAISSDMKFLDFLKQVARNTYRDFDNRKYPFELLVEKIGIPANRNRNPLFDVVLSSVDLGDTSTGSDIAGEVSLEYIEQQFVKVSFDLLLTFTASKGTRNFSFEYNVNLFKQETVRSYASFIQDIMQQVVKEPATTISDINLSGLLWEKAFHNQLYSGPATNEKEAGHVLQQISRVAAQKGNKVALIDGGLQMSYTQLMEEADKLAVCLIEQYNISEHDRIAIYLERSAHFVVAVLAVLKIRAVFIPIDVSMPEQRMKYILRHAECKAILTVADSMFRLSHFDGPVFAMDIQMDILPAVAPLNFTGCHDDLAYILFTSGSTGYPKGVKVGHASFGNYVTWANGYYFNYSGEYDMPLYTSVSFDFTLTSIFSPLTRGAAIHICKEDTDIYQTLKYIFSPGLRAVKITPAHIDALETLRLGATDIEIAIVGGEELLPHHVSVLRKLNPGIRIYNEYGPTEATVACSASLVDDSNDLITIGRPVNNSRIFIVDQDMRLLPSLASGEILISGDCLSAGYIDPEQDREKFIEIEIDGRMERMYRSGDKGLYIASNEIVYLGRISANDQVKIKGFRIELKEIEACLMRIGKIDRSIIVVRKINGEDVLVAYYLAKEELDEKRIKSYLGKFLPRQMIPAIIIRLQHLPLNVNGKIDYKALPDPSVSTGRIYIPPVSEIEMRMVDIWSEILGMEKGKIGLTDGFFSLGGNSLKVVQLGQKIEDVFGIAIPVAEFFDNDSISSIISNFFNASSVQMK